MLLRDDMKKVAAVGKVEDAGKVLGVPTAVEVGGVGEWESVACELRARGERRLCKLPNTGNREDGKSEN